MNKSILIGRLTKDPTLVFAPGNGTAVSKFTIAVNRAKAKDGKQEADFIGCVAFGKTAETIAQYLTKGKQLAIEGHIITGHYTAKDGHEVYTTEVAIDKFEFIGAKEETAVTSNNDMTPIEDDGDIPF